VFIDQLVKRNPALARAAVELQQRGDVPAGAYVIDLDVLHENARLICAEAARLGLTVFGMTKQFGRNPVAIQTLQRAGVERFVAVDMGCAEAIDRAGARLGHVGHLVQVPTHAAARAAALQPDYWTVFDLRKAREAGAAARALGDLNRPHEAGAAARALGDPSKAAEAGAAAREAGAAARALGDLNRPHEAGAAARALGREQPILARIFGDGDMTFESDAGGFDAEDMEWLGDSLAAVDGCRFAGVTSYPALTFNPETRMVEPTPNLATMARVAEKLQRLGYGPMEVNAPGHTSTAVLRLLADAGATQVEPGHGFTGTTPLHAVADLPERPAIVFVTEVSHLSDAGGGAALTAAGDAAGSARAAAAYCFGGGLYQDVDTVPALDDPVGLPGPLEALVGPDPDEALRHRAVAHLPDYQVIDFYGRLTAREGAIIRPGDSVVFCFRPQVFYTRALVVPVGGIASGAPKVEGLFDAQGRAV
jgi:predicted amino acid racemase